MKTILTCNAGPRLLWFLSWDLPWLFYRVCGLLNPCGGKCTEKTWIFKSHKIITHSTYKTVVLIDISLDKFLILIIASFLIHVLEIHYSRIRLWAFLWAISAMHNAFFSCSMPRQVTLLMVSSQHVFWRPLFLVPLTVPSIIVFSS